MKSLILKSIILLCLCFAVLHADADPIDKKMKRNGRQSQNHNERSGNERSEHVRDVHVSQLNYGGLGCPNGTVQVVFAPDNLSFSLLFDQFIAQTGTDTDSKKQDIMTCNLVIPLQIPANMQMSITRVDYRGFTGLPEGARAQLNSSYNFLPRRFQRGDREGDPVRLNYQFSGPLMEDYAISSDVIEDASTIVSPCGGDVFLRIQNSLQIMATQRNQQASISIDSIDGSSNAVYFVNWKQCDPNREQDQNRGRGHGLKASL